MAEQKSLKKNMLMNMILTMSNFVFPMITFSYVARVLMPAGTGKVAFVQSALSYFSYIAVLGIPSYGLRECAKVRDDRGELSHVFRELLLINFCSTIVSYICLGAAMVLIPHFIQYRSLFLVMSTGIVLKTIGVEWFYQALEEYSYITVRSLVFKCTAVILTFILIREPDDYIWYGFLTIFTSSASNLCNFFRVKKYVSFRKTAKYHFSRHLKPIFLLFSASIIVSIYANFDVVMIGFIKSDNEVGLYNAALKIKSIVLAISMAVSNVLIPRVAYYFERRNAEKIKEISVKSLKLSMLFTIPVAVYILIYADNVIRFVCGKEYMEAVPTVRILILCILPLILTYLFGQQLLIPMGLEKRYSQSVFVGLWINLILNLLMIPHMGSLGAAIGTLVTECWNVYWMGGGIKDYRNDILKRIGFSKYIVALLLGVITSMTVYYIVSDLTILIQLVTTTTSMFGIYYFLLLLYGETTIRDIVAFLRKKAENLFS